MILTLFEKSSRDLEIHITREALTNARHRLTTLANGRDNTLNGVRPKNSLN